MWGDEWWWIEENGLRRGGIKEHKEGIVGQCWEGWGKLGREKAPQRYKEQGVGVGFEVFEHRWYENWWSHTVKSIKVIRSLVPVFQMREFRHFPRFPVTILCTIYWQNKHCWIIKTVTWSASMSKAILSWHLDGLKTVFSAWPPLSHHFNLSFWHLFPYDMHEPLTQTDRGPARGGCEGHGRTNLPLPYMTIFIFCCCCFGSGLNQF